MSKTDIDWCDYSLNPVMGLCPMVCPYCYARRMYNNPYYKTLYDNRDIQFKPSVFNDIPKMKAGSRVFVGSTMELFGKWIDPEWMRLIMERVKAHPELTFIFLSKQPYNLRKWSPFPKNAWVGVSTTGFDSRSYLEDDFRDIEAKVKFVSIEPLLDYSPMDFRWVNWVICGRQTPKSEKTKPHIEWLIDIAKETGRYRVPLFLKDNLREAIGIRCMSKKWLFNDKDELRQEFPHA